MSDITSKNLFALLGDEGEGDRPQPVYEKTKPATSGISGREISAKDTASKKRDPSAPTPRERHVRDNAVGKTFKTRRSDSGNEGAFRDKTVGHQTNRSRPTAPQDTGSGKDVTPAFGKPRGGGRGRGRGGERGREFDRRSSTGVRDTNKQTAQGWGYDGRAQQNAEDLAEQDRIDEGVEDAAPTAKNPEGEEVVEAPEPAEPEPEEKSYQEYLAEREASRNHRVLEARAANEGSQDLLSAQKLSKGDDNASYFNFSQPKKENSAKAPKQRKEKQLLDIEQVYAPPAGSSRGGRGGRGGRGRGGTEGGSRGTRGGRGGRGAYRGQGLPTTSSSKPVQITESDFPKLG